MKFVVVVVLVALIVCAHADGEEKKKKCKNQDDCGDDECCVYKGFFRGGECKGKAKEKERCNTEDAKIDLLGGKFLLHCPCTAGFKCEPEEVRDIPIIGKVKINERCVAEGSE